MPQLRQLLTRQIYPYRWRLRQQMKTYLKSLSIAVRKSIIDRIVSDPVRRRRSLALHRSRQRRRARQLPPPAQPSVQRVNFPVVPTWKHHSQNLLHPPRTPCGCATGRHLLSHCRISRKCFMAQRAGGSYTSSPLRMPGGPKAQDKPAQGNALGWLVPGLRPDCILNEELV